MIVGRTAGLPDTMLIAGASMLGFDLGAGKLARDFTVGAVLVNVVGQGGATSQPMRALVAESDNLNGTLRLGREVIVPAEPAANRWVWLPFDDPPRLHAGRGVVAGFMAGAGVAVLVKSAAGSAGTMQSWSTSYLSAGYPDPLPAPSGDPLLGAVAVVGVEPWQLPNVSNDELVRTLPLGVLSDYFASAGTVGDPVSAVAGWHYTHDAPPPPATCVVRTGGPLEGLVGERVLITAEGSPYGPQSVALYVADERPFDDELGAEDLSLSRAAFARLAPLWTDVAEVTVEVLG